MPVASLAQQTDRTQLSILRLACWETCHGDCAGKVTTNRGAPYALSMVKGHYDICIVLALAFSQHGMAIEPLESCTRLTP